MKMHNNKECFTILALGLAVISGAMLTGCGRSVQVVNGINGAKGDKGDQGFGAGVFVESVPGLCGLTDGVRITTFQDKNNNGLKELDESTNAVTSVCNGANGSNGQNGANGTNATISVSSVAPSCSAGGYTLTTTSGAVSSSYPICNGVQGSQGLQGSPGIAGANGLDGTNGTVVTPVKFCNNDTSQFPEYGLYIGGELFAVYWGSTPASSASQAFLSKLVPGSYMSTGGNNCAFTINANSQVH